MRRCGVNGVANVGSVGMRSSTAVDGYGGRMADPRLEDHAVGVELQLTELTEELERARVQGRRDRMAEIERELAALRDDLAATAERIADEHFDGASIHAEHAG
jgi:hypothetical protein